MMTSLLSEPVVLSEDNLGATSYRATAPDTAAVLSVFAVWFVHRSESNAITIEW